MDDGTPKTPTRIIISKPTMCLHCHCIVELQHDVDADPVKGAWTCPGCGHLYPFVHWKIKPMRGTK